MSKSNFCKHFTGKLHEIFVQLFFSYWLTITILSTNLLLQSLDWGFVQTFCYRLWAEIFEVQEENGEICWGRVSDDVVPVNITCIQNHPNTVFQITAYNRHVEKIFDVRLIQPGELQPPSCNKQIVHLGFTPFQWSWTVLRYCRLYMYVQTPVHLSATKSHQEHGLTYKHQFLADICTLTK